MAIEPIICCLCGKDITLDSHHITLDGDMCVPCWDALFGTADADAVGSEGVA